MKSIFIYLFFSLSLLVDSSSSDGNSIQLLNNQDKNIIIVYGSDSCHYCVDTKTFLKENEIAFKFYDIDVDDKALKEMLKKLRKQKISTSDLKIPVIDKNGELFMNDGDFDDFLKKLKD